MIPGVQHESFGIFLCRQYSTFLSKTFLIFFSPKAALANIYFPLSCGKVLDYHAFVLRFEGGRFLYKLHRSPMCEYMINFILKLKHLPEKYMMNSVLENFTILQVSGQLM
jgi:hypothetical protein